MNSIGMSDKWGFGELFGFEEELLTFIPQPVVGVIIAQERLKDVEEQEKGSEQNNQLVQYYMKQTGTLDNACGIIACLHAIFNNPNQVEIEVDSILGKYLSDVQNKTPAERATALENNEGFKTKHKEFAAEGQSAQITDVDKQEDVKHHFVAFVLSDGKLIELDGTKKGPNIVLDHCEDALRGAIQVI